MTAAPPGRFAFLAFEVDERQRRLRGADGETIPLRPRVFDTLMVLVRHAGETVTKEEMLAAVWQDTVVEENNLNQAISSLRQALGDDRRNPTCIATIPGRGYQFIAPVSVLAPTDAGPGDASSRAGGDGDAAPVSVTDRRNPRRLAALAVLGAVVAVALGWLLGAGNAGAPPPFSLAGARLVTSLPALHRAPALSPDGTLMAYVSDRSGIEQIWVRGLPDGTPIQLTKGVHPATAPSWSPVDQTILFERQTDDGRPAIWLIDALASNPARLVERNATQARFAPDGRSFVFVRNQAEIHVGFLGGAPSRRVPLPETADLIGPRMPAINARGDVAFVLADEGPSGDLWLYDAAAQRSSRLTESGSGFAGIWVRAPVWLPDSRTVIYVASEDGLSNSHLYSLDVDTGRQVQLSTGPGGYSAPALSGDGTRLAYAYARPVWRLVRTDPRTGAERVLHASRSPIALPTVSPDGRTVAFFGEHVYTLEIDGGELIQWTSDERGAVSMPGWSRSDGSLYLYRGRALHRLERPGPSELVRENFHWSSKNWLAVHGSRLAYRERLFPPGRARTVIEDLDTGEKQILQPPMAPTDWSRDGRFLLARVAPGADLVICAAPAFLCEPIRHDGEPVGGARPRWSADEQRVFFRRIRHDKPGYAWIWAVDRNGGAPERLVEVGPSEPDDGVFFGVAYDDSLIWNQFEHLGGSDIWVVDRSGGASRGAR